MHICHAMSRLCLSAVAALALALALGCLACDVEEPETAIWSAGEAPPPIDPEDRLGCAIDDVTDHQGVAVRHQLPDGVEPAEPLTITVVTPCAADTTTTRHDREGVAEATVIAPAGAACMLSVTVEIANDRQVCAAGTADPKECAGLDELCAADEPGDL